jgi:RND family efflux transporter MFP subunit
LDREALKIDRSGAATRRRRRRRSSLVGWAALLGLLLGGGWLFRAPLTELLDRLRLPEVRLARVTRTSAAAAAAVAGTAANGYVVARTRAALSADTPGRIVEMNVVEGSVVKRGDVVARLFSEEVAAALAAAEAELDSARVSVTRVEADVAVAAADVERARSNIDAAEAALDEARAAAGLARINVGRLRELATSGIEPQQRLDEAQAEAERTSAAVAAAQARLVTAQRDEALASRREAAAVAAVDEARSRLPVLEARREQARATLDKTNVRAPFDGVVVLKDAEVGEVVSPNSQGAQSRGSVATMVDFASLEVQVELPETSLSAAEVGAPATVFLDAFPADAYPGSVLRIWPTANRQKASVEIRVGFEAPDERLRPEMGARVVFLPPEAQQPAAAGPDAGNLLVATGCVVRRGGGTAAFVLEGDTVRLRALELGQESGGRVVVLAGLEEGERVVLDPPTSLADGDRVRVARD